MTDKTPINVYHHHPSRYRLFTACYGSEFLTSETYESIWTVGSTPWTRDKRVLMI